MSDTDGGGSSLAPIHICRVHITKFRLLPLMFANLF